jgi:hypothetical protein
MAGEFGPVLELAGVEQGLVVPSELERIAGFFRRGRHLLLGAAGTVPREKGDNGLSM